MKGISIALGILFSFSLSQAQWNKINSIPSQDIVALASMQDTLYAASASNLLYKSTDHGATWKALTVSAQSIGIFSLQIIDQTIYTGTLDHGIFTSENFGASWTQYNPSLPAVSGFAKFEDHIYASTIGSGVYRYEAAGNTWGAFNNALPASISHNVETIVATPDKLLIGAGGNGTYYHYNFDLNQWEVGYYYGVLSPGLIIHKIVHHADTLFAVTGNRIIRSTDGGVNWTNDHTGANNGLDRNIFVGTTDVYTITNLPGNGTWIQKRNKNAATGSSWETDEELFPTGYSYDIFEYNTRLYLAKEDGLYAKDLLLEVEEPNSLLTPVSLFPNPASVHEQINLISPVKIKRMRIFNASGQLVYEATPLTQSIELNGIFPEKGIYFISIATEHEILRTRKLLVK